MKLRKKEFVKHVSFKKGVKECPVMDKQSGESKEEVIDTGINMLGIKKLVPD